MTSIHAAGGISTAYSVLTAPNPSGPVEHADKLGPPDHAKAWGWRAKQPAPTEAAQPAPPEPPAEIPAPTGINALLGGNFGEISIKIENAAGEFKIEVSRDDDGLKIEIESKTDGGEIKIEFESGEHGGFFVKFESDELGEIELSVSNLRDSDPAADLQISDLAAADDAEPTAPPPSGADMQTVVLSLAYSVPTPTGTGAMTEYDKMKALFS